MSRTFKFAIASGSRRVLIESFLNKYQLNQLIMVIISAEDLQFPKPHPEVYLKALAGLDLSSREVIAIEDSNLGVEAAQTANIFTVGLNMQNKSDLKADLVVSKFQEISEWLNK